MSKMLTIPCYLEISITFP